MTPPAPVRARRRALWGWAAVCLAIVLVGLAAAPLVGRGWVDPEPLDPESAGPSGTRALVSILADQGVDVTVSRSRDDALAALDSQTTLILPDVSSLSDDALAELAAAAGDIVLAEPRSRTLDLLLPGSDPSGSAGTDELDPACTVPAAERAGSITGGTLATPGDAVAGCYPADGAFALLTLEQDGRTISALDGRTVLANDALDQAGNAALALALTGSQPTAVWYMPALADADSSGAPPTLGELTPDWVTPAMVLLMAAALAAAFWRGRRFGPLVVERLPVTVRATETTTGRARLYARARDAGHALDQLRLGAIERLGRMLALPAHSDPAAIADAAARRLQVDRADVHAVLLDDIPRTDRELLELAERLRELEARVHAAVRPERNTP